VQTNKLSVCIYEFHVDFCNFLRNWSTKSNCYGRKHLEVHTSSLILKLNLKKSSVHQNFALQNSIRLFFNCSFYKKNNFAHINSDLVVDKNNAPDFI